MIAVLWAGLAAFASTALCLVLALRSATLRRTMSDAPNERSLHKVVTPRFGGLGLMAGVTVGLITGWLTNSAVTHGLTEITERVSGSASATLWSLWLLGGYLLLALVSAVDDRRSLSAAVRMLIHMAVAAVWASLTDLSLPLMACLTLGLVWSMNLYNFMDGADGLAGGMAVFGFGAYAVASVMSASPASLIGLPASVSADIDITLVSVVISAAALGFLCLNFPPARLFMGDAGSIPLGFGAAAIGLHGWQVGLWSPLFPLIVFFPFAFDATLTLIGRLLRSQRIWEAHREHLYQRVVLAGMTHRAMTLRAYGLMALCASAALLSRNFATWIETLIIATQSIVGLALAAKIAGNHASEHNKS